MHRQELITLSKVFFAYRNRLLFQHKGDLKEAKEDEALQKASCRQDSGIFHEIDAGINAVNLLLELKTAPCASLSEKRSIALARAQVLSDMLSDLYLQLISELNHNYCCVSSWQMAALRRASLGKEIDKTAEELELFVTDIFGTMNIKVLFAALTKDLQNYLAAEREAAFHLSLLSDQMSAKGFSYRVERLKHKIVCHSVRAKLITDSIHALGANNERIA